MSRTPNNNLVVRPRVTSVVSDSAVSWAKPKHIEAYVEPYLRRRKSADVVIPFSVSLFVNKHEHVEEKEVRTWYLAELDSFTASEVESYENLSSMFSSIVIPQPQQQAKQHDVEVPFSVDEFVEAHDSVGDNETKTWYRADLNNPTVSERRWGRLLTLLPKTTTHT